MLYERMDIIKSITRTFSILMSDIKLHQSMNDFSINIHAEDFFKDVINDLYGTDYKNANSAGKNESYIDLVDDTNKKIIQVTTTVTKHKIENSLKYLRNPQYKTYDFEIFYLLEKPTNFNKASIEDFKTKYGIDDIYPHLKDSTDLVDKIKNTDIEKLKGIYKTHFYTLAEKYTDEIALQIVFELLLKASKEVRFNYDDDFGSISTPEKIELNDLNTRITNSINQGLDYTQSIYLHVDPQQLSDLQSLIVDDYYAKILRKELRMHQRMDLLCAMEVAELHALAAQTKISFNKVLYNLKERIEEAIIKIDFNSNSVSWIIIAYFFEICKVGMKDDSTD